MTRTGETLKRQKEGWNILILLQPNQRWSAKRQTEAVSVGPVPSRLVWIVCFTMSAEGNKAEVGFKTNICVNKPYNDKCHNHVNTSNISIMNLPQHGSVGAVGRVLCETPPPLARSKPPRVPLTCKKTPNIIIMNVKTNMANAATHCCQAGGLYYYWEIGNWLLTKSGYGCIFLCS